MNEKQCRYCNKFYPEESFGVAKSTEAKIYRRRKCRDCYRATKHVLTSRIHEWIIDFKEKRGCGLCGIVDYRVLDLHHPDEEKKNFTIAYFRRGLGFDKIMKEVEKCEVLCANCHRIHHWEKRKNKQRGVA